MIIVKASLKDVDEIIEIVKQQRLYLKENGIPQWQGEYPSYDTFKSDIELDRLYVMRQDDRVVGFFALVYPDHCYDYVENGAWMDDSEYIAVHRMGIANEYKGRGYSSEAFRWIKDRYPHVKVDTHEVNNVMNRSLRKNGFTMIGVVYMEDKTPRNAYEWIKK